MPANVELKALLPDPDRALSTLEACSRLDRQDHFQRDIFLPSTTSYLKLRYNDGRLDAMISYERSTMPFARDSNFVKIDLVNDAIPTSLVSLLESVSPVGLVEKQRTRFSDASVIINVDVVSGVGPLIEIEVLDALDPTAQREVCDRWSARLSLTPDLVLPYSNIHLVQIHAKKNDLCPSSPLPKLLALDDIFASPIAAIAEAYQNHAGQDVGVTTLECSLSNHSPYEHTRPLQSVSRALYFSKCLRGEYCMFFDLAFSRGFGLPWGAVTTSRHDLLVVPLPPGGGPFFKSLFPLCKTVLLLPNMTTFERHLLTSVDAAPSSRRVLQNYLDYAWQRRHCYDVVIATDGLTCSDIGSAIFAATAQ